MTISLPAAAAGADAAAVPPFAARRSTASDTRSKPVTRCPAVTRLAAIGAPILPSPINPIVAIYWFPSGSAASGEVEFSVADRRKIRVDHVVGHFGERCRPPARLLILVDQRRPHPFVEIMRRHHMLGQPVFEGKRRVEIVRSPDRELPQRDLQAAWRLGQQ